ncbi:hypothetical protein GGR52DRAFT_123899 [Hypoxylon sp. FL1284]|nr:hypothetical protein GGR52DRAFT_123899 [Hypoxylon sp. FL1284]
MSNHPPVSLANVPRHVRSRTQSISSDRPSTAGLGLMSPPLSISPEAAFIATSAASQIVTNDHDSHSETWYDQVGVEPSEETAFVSQGALQLANNFVDQLLFNIIAVAKSTSLSALRPAVSEVLKPKLAKDAVNNADEELREYLGGGEIEDLTHAEDVETPADWDLELVWKRTRLRCMVYSSLGDMEEEDEDYHMEQEHLRGESDGLMSDIVSPAVAIFLTSILEFMGEQVLVIAGQAAFNRLRLKYEKELKDGTRTPGEYFDRIVVEELDMERVALDRTLGRLWRGWKKRIRLPLEPNYSRPFSRSSAGGSGVPHTRRGSAATLLTPKASDPALEVQKEHESEAEEEKATKKPEIVRLEPADVPLPDSDVEATYSDEEESEEDNALPVRPKSLIIFTITTPSKTSIKRVRSFPSRRRSRHPSPTPLSRELSNDGDHPAEGPAQEAQKVNIDGSVVHKEARDVSKRPELEATNSLPLRVNTDAGPVEQAATAAAARTEGEDDIDEFSEEPEILTSSRVSIGGRSSPATSESGKPAPLVHVRTNSVRSVRVIEVQSPRSPTMGSRTNSMDLQDLMARRISTPPIAEEQHTQAPSANAAKKNPVVVQKPHDDSQEINVPVGQPVRNPSPLRSVLPQSAPQPSVPAQVTMLSAPYPDAVPVERSVTPMKSSRSPPLPTLPERSTSRPVYARSGSTGVSSEIAMQQAAPDSPKLSRPAPHESPSSSSSKFKAVRTSEDSVSRRPEARARDFENLIHSGETIQYTLTPENMRDMDSVSSHHSQHSASPKLPNKSDKSETKFFERSRSSSASIKRSVSITKQTSLGSHPPTDVPIAATLPASVAPKGRSAVIPQAREARIPQESLQDFADFIRSTGPPGERAARPNQGNAGATAGARSAVPAHVVKNASIDSKRSDLTARSRYQARDATANVSSESSDLIDFIRRGPPNNNANNPRIPRHVAPFRSTMDSDQMQMTGAVGGKAIDAVLPSIRNSEASTNITETSAPSSLNSQSALLNKANRAQPYAGNNFDEDDMMPKRTRRRVKDPYAIDFSDEEEDEDDYEIIPKPKPKQEESLIDFLNNYPPPPEPTPEPVAMPKKKSSAPNLIARLRSGGNSISKSASNGPPKGINTTESRSLSSRAGTSRGYTPIVVPTGAENYGIETKPPPVMPSGSTGRVPMAPSSSAGRVPMKKFEPREAQSAADTRTSDLASFLRDSEPPPQTMASLSSPTETKGTGFSRMFERRKKSTAY